MQPILTLFTLFLSLTPLVLTLPHSLPLTLQTTHSSHRFTFRRSSIHFPSSPLTTNHRSFLPSSPNHHQNLFPSHDQKSKLKRGGTAETQTAKPFSFEIWDRLTNPQNHVSGSGEGVGGIGGSGEVRPEQLSIFSGGAVGVDKGEGKKRRTFGFLRDSVALRGGGEGGNGDGVFRDGRNMNPHPSGKHSNKNPSTEKVTAPTAPLRVSMEDFKSFFGSSANEGKEPGQSGFQKWFGWGKKE